MPAAGLAAGEFERAVLVFVVFVPGFEVLNQYQPPSSASTKTPPMISSGVLLFVVSVVFPVVFAIPNNFNHYPQFFKYKKHITPQTLPLVRSEGI